MGKLGSLVLPLVLVAILSGCAAPAADQVSSPLRDMIDLIPWARDIGDTATTEEVAARIDEIAAELPALGLAYATRRDLEGKLKRLAIDVNAESGNLAEEVAELRAIIDEVKAAAG